MQSSSTNSAINRGGGGGGALPTADSFMGTPGGDRFMAPPSHLSTSFHGASRFRRAVDSVMQSHNIDVHLRHQAFTPNTLETESLDQVPEFKALHGESDEQNFSKFLRTVPHLYMLPESENAVLARAMLRREFASLDSILERGSDVKHAYVVLQGAVEVFAPSRVGTERVGTVPRGNLFCFDSIIFCETSPFWYKAGNRRTVLGLIPGKVFMEVLGRNVPMAQSIGRKLSEHMDIFICFKEFCRHVFSHESAKNEYLPLWNILDAYVHMENCIHAKMTSPSIDCGAWLYASRRLPENVTSTFCFDLVRALPPFVAKRMRVLASTPGARNAGDLKYVETKERRRCSWQLGMEGKTLVLLRDGFTDLLDFITCMCIHIIEAQKLRARLQGMVHPPAIDILDEFLHPEGANSPTTAQMAQQTDEVLERMPLSKEERAGIKKIWPNNCLKKMHEIIMHREEYIMRVDASVSKRFQIDPFHEWALNLRAAVMRAMKLSPQAPLPDDLVIDVISSNTHTIQNLLMPFMRMHRDAIRQYAEAKRQDLTSLEWFTEEDMLYSVMPGFLAENPELKAAYKLMLQHLGVQVMEDTAMTGLQVDVIPVASIDMAQVDAKLGGVLCHASNERHFILNMDFAFGAQVDGMMKTLVTTFHTHIRSINVMGKAGGLVGNRGDIQFATHVVLSKSALTTDDCLDELRSCGNADISAAQLQDLVGPRVKVHSGPVLTIPGTMLQNIKLLRYYSAIWRCVGVEMEGSYFARQIKESMKAKLLRPDVQTRFAYYTSDLPLHAATDTNLATPMKPNEGIPPLYAIARAVLQRILTPDESTPCFGRSGGSTAPPTPKGELAAAIAAAAAATSTSELNS